MQTLTKYFARSAWLTVSLLVVCVGCDRGPASSQPGGKALVDGSARGNSNGASSTGGTEAGGGDDLVAEMAGEVRSFCGYCHAPPTPDLAPREAWAHEVQEGFNFHSTSQRRDQVGPDQTRVLEYFARQATPANKVPAPPNGPLDPGRLRFRPHAIPMWGANAQGQRSLTRYSGEGLHKEMIIPSAATAFHDQAIFCWMLLEQR